MSGNEQITISVQQAEEIIEKLKQISSLCCESNLKTKIEVLQSFVSSILNPAGELSVQEVIYEKMVEVKLSNPDLHLKLYMLYRNLMNSKISEIDAMDSFENALSMYPPDIILY
ncbi:hypothetical protein [Clostridium sp.]|uniref:hypothetical protein n=1 Tax=Clostridium sp. TaxID=1506 RepID=UPI001A557228|nr:hypothetical protein [Clostridium sp.]MBK5240396.1 hypothetical protein [Clostridium sp.]